MRKLLNASSTGIPRWQVEKAQHIRQSEQETEKIRINAKGVGKPPKLILEASSSEDER